MPMVDTTIQTSSMRKLSAAIVVLSIPENELAGVGIGCFYILCHLEKLSFELKKCFHVKFI
jgi:hypothetical protein